MKDNHDVIRLWREFNRGEITLEELTKCLEQISGESLGRKGSHYIKAPLKKHVSRGPERTPYAE